MNYGIAGNFGGGAKFCYFRGPVSGTKFKTHNLCTMTKCEVFKSRNKNHED